MNFFTGSAMWQLIMQSDMTSKVVLLILLGMSIVCWTVFFAKLFIFKIKNKQLHDGQSQLLHIITVNELIDYAYSRPKTVPGYFITANLMFIKKVTNSNLNKEISDKDWMLIENHCDAIIDTIVLHNDSYLSILSSCAAVAPLLGLFGTVWGLVHAFMRISETQIADIATIAPGIAEALITTLAGLIIAIPALVMFNYLQTKMRLIEHNLIMFADKVLYVLQQLREKQ